MMWDEWSNQFGEQQQGNEELGVEEEEEEAFNKQQQQEQQQNQEDGDSFLDFDFFSVLSKPKDYYRILEVDYDAEDDVIRSNYIRLALKWHPDKQKDQDRATTKFQEINEAYQVKIKFVTDFECSGEMRAVLSDPVKRYEYNQKGMLRAYDYNLIDYLNRYKGLILTCNGLGMKYSIL